ncbi:MAG: alpha-L-arabinofuranosidase [Fibrobacteres bacterium]|nr:alpha-L-arabinofuranosidase [Fibrobacterota bacterium]
MSPYLIGENSFNADAPGKDADRVWSRMKDARFRLIRIGGISNNDRTPSPENHARWIDSIRSIGAEPLVQVSSIDPAATAADLVRYLNVDRKYGIRFWSIGNEPTCVEKTTPTVTAAIAANVKARALAMKAVDPTIKILFGDECYWKPDLYDPLIGGANDVTGESGGVRYIDGVTFHTYPLPGANKDAPYTRNDVVSGAVANVRGQFQKCRAAAAAADAAHNRTGDARLSISLTEFNVTYWNSSDNTPSGVGVRSFVAGQFVAEVFGMGMEYGALTVAPWSMLESGGDGRAGDLGLFDGAGDIVPRPAYHHIKMIADNMSGGFIASSAEKADLVRTYATQDKDQAAILILNEHLTAGYRFTLRFTAQSGPAAARPALHMDAGWDGEITDSIPAQATLLLKVRKPGEVLTRTLYTLAMAEKYQPPVVKVMPVSIRSGAGGEARPAAGAGHSPHLLYTGRDGFAGELAQAGPYQAVLADFRGRVVSRSSGNAAIWSLPVSGLRAGGYVLRLRAGGITTISKAAIP